VASEQVSFSSPIRFGEDFELDLRAFELRRAGRPIKLERIPMDLLVLLVEQRGQLVSREQIIERIWGKDVFLDTDNSINAAIRKIRQALKDDPEKPRFIQTITGRGYRFIAPIVDASPVSGAGAVAPKPVPDAGTADGLIGRKISHYRILELLGGGGMGVVYKAEDLKLGRRVALKFLPSELANDPKAFDRFEREARAASALDHPNICSIYQLGEYEGQPFIVMQLLEGQTLREWIEAETGQETSSRVKRLIDLGTQIADGLDAAHSKGIIHRDIKPANIFVTSRGQAKILDFGVAKFLELKDGTAEAGDAVLDTASSANPALTRTGISMGTPFYLSPEQLRGEPLDARTDLFSFGLVLYEMATGRRAFAGNTTAVIRDAVLHQAAAPARQLNAEIPAALETVIGKALEKARTQRYQSAAEIRTDLEQLRRSVPVVAQQPRKSWPWISLAAAVMVLALFAANVGGLRDKAFRRRRNGGAVAVIKPRPTIAVLGFKNLSGKTDEAWISTALAEMVGMELGSGQQMRVIPSENVARMKLDLSLPAADAYSQDTLTKIRNHLGTDMIVSGSYLALGGEAGRKIRIDLQLQDTKAGETIAMVSQEGSEADLAELVSRGGLSVRQKLGIGELSSSDARQVRATIPTSPEAARRYAEGLAKLQTFDALGARDLLQQAIKADPNHALSHSALAESWSALGYDGQAAGEAKKAFDLSANLSREDHLSIEARYRQLNHDTAGAVEIYRTLYGFFPDNVEYGLRLAKAQSIGTGAKDALETISRIRNSGMPQASDARVDLQEAATARVLADFKHEQQSAAAAAAKGQAQGAALIVAQAKLLEGWAWDHLGDLQKAMADLTEARDLSAGKNPHTVADAQLFIGHVLYDQGNFDQARKSYEQALKGFQAVGDQVGISNGLEAVGNVLVEQGSLAEARQYYEGELRTNREIGRKNGIAASALGLGNLFDQMGDLSNAAKMDEQALQSFRELGNKRGEATANGNWGLVLVEQGNLAAAKSKTDEAMKLQRETGYKRGVGFSLWTLAEILRLQDHLDDARQTEEEAIALRKEIGDDGNLARSQMHLAQITLDQGHAEAAEPLARAAAEASGKLKIPENEAHSDAILAASLLALKRTSEAQAAANQALAASRKADRLSRFEAAIASAEVSAASGRFSDAVKTLETMRAEARHYGYLIYDMEGRLHLGQMELRVGKATGRVALQQLRDEARSDGYLLIARQADTALKH